MPNIDLSNVTAATGGGGGSYHLAPGGYVLRVIDYEVQFRRQYVRLKFDVDEGPCAGTFANAMWPISDIVSWSDKSLPYLKAKLQAFAESNAPWDAEDAFRRDAWQEFVGMRVGAVVRDRIYTGRDGADKTGNEIYQLCPTEAIAKGDFVVPGPKDDRKGAEQAASNPPMAAAAPMAAPAPQSQQYQPQMPPQYPQPQQYQPQPQQYQHPAPQYQQPAMEPAPWEQ